MYQDYFGLTEQAFSIAVNPRYLYMSPKHREALAHLLYGVQGGGFVMLTGEVGTGKTTIVRSLLEQLPKGTEIAIILNPMANVLELLQTICDELGAEYDDDKVSLKRLTDALQSKLLENHRNGKNTVLLIDEAQLLAAEVLEQVRLLTNLETTTEKLLQIILVGQPELNDLLAQPKLRQLSQRIVARYHLTPLSQAETQHYIEHRLQVAGWKQGRIPFPEEIIKKIQEFSGGIPRIINVLCERMLIGAYSLSRKEVDIEIFNLSKKEIAGNAPELTKGQKAPAARTRKQSNTLVTILATALVACFALIAVFGYLLYSDTINHSSATAAVKNNHNSPSHRSGTAATQINSADAANQPTPVLNPEQFLLRNAGEAQQPLFTYLGVQTSSATPPCWQTDDHGIECSETTLTSWDDLRNINRPAILSVVTEEKFSGAVLLIGLSDDSALLLDANNRQHQVALTALGKMWNGSTTYVWKRPNQFDAPLKLGDNNALVADVAAKFAYLDNKTTPLSEGRFNRQLQTRVKLFQSQSGLENDGILGQRTLMKLNDALSDGFPLLNQF